VPYVSITDRKVDPDQQSELIEEAKESSKQFVNDLLIGEQPSLNMIGMQ
jgi:hypothetical protein